MGIAENYKEIRQRIEEACKRVSRDTKDVELIAVSKTRPVSEIEIARSLSMESFGENRVNELRKKMEEISVSWHFIGHLQTNKVKYIVGKVALIHSLDSIRLAEEISRCSMKKSLVSDVLIEVNVAEEESKFGIRTNELESFIREVSQYEGLRIRGLMTVAPYTENGEENRPYFRELKKIMVDLNNKNIDNINMNVLSMGMTGDYEVAIEEGATLIRIGTGIFGSRIVD